ncbi:F-box-like domain-containing protein [Ceratobasidium sp. AG-Ba]|nr:F-box-like domain-containing protein [Ceratobasidium sp. AG-Ba]QRW13575.1 F-box-like domain-containing protein [Ceratobasidium sp. AG-Ba]
MGLRLPSHALPNLKHLACAAPALAHIPSRKLAHVTLLDAPFIPLLGTAYISALSEAGSGDKKDDESGEGVRSVELRLGQVVVNTIQAPLILEPFSQHVPALRRLSVVAGRSFFNQDVLESLTPALVGFTELEKLDLECNSESECDPLDKDATLKLLRAWQSSCPSIKHVKLPWRNSNIDELG